MELIATYLARRNSAILIDDWPGAWRSHFEFARRFPHVEPALQSLTYCARIRDDRVGNDLVRQLMLDTDYDGAALFVRRKPDFPLQPQVLEEIQNDERRVFDDVVSKARFSGRETLVEGNRRGPIALLTYHTRSGQCSREEFLLWWGEWYRNVVHQWRQESSIDLRYAHVRFDEIPDGFTFDGMSEAWFENLEQLRSWSHMIDASRDVQFLRSCDLLRTVALVTEPICCWENGAPRPEKSSSMGSRQS